MPASSITRRLVDALNAQASIIDSHTTLLAQYIEEHVAEIDARDVTLADHGARLDAQQDALDISGLIGPPHIDLRLSPHNIVASDPAANASNTVGLNAAILAYSGTGARLKLPSGVVYVGQANPGLGPSSRIYSILFGLGVTDVALVGEGMHSTTILMQDDGNFGHWDAIRLDGCRRITLSDFTVKIGNIPNQHIALNSLITVNATKGVVTQDILCERIYFSDCIGDAFRIIGDPAGIYVDGVKLLNFIMRVGDHPVGYNFLQKGARSGVSLQRGFKNVEIGHGYLEGAKNSLFEIEPTAGNAMDQLLVHNLIINNERGTTWCAAAFSGFSETSPLRNSTMRDIVILQGGVVVQNNRNCTVENVLCYSTGLGPMTGNSAALLQVNNSMHDVKLRNVNIHRCAGSTPGPLATLISGVVSGSEGIAIEGGTWRTSVGAGAGLTYVDLQAMESFAIRGLRVVLGASASNEFAFKVRTNGWDCASAAFSDIDLRASARLTGVYLASTNGKKISHASVTGLRAPRAVTTGVLLDVNGGTGVDPNPIIQGCDFCGATNAWLAINAAAGVVFPVIAGNKGGVCSLVGTVAPNGAVTAVQGSQYAHQGTLYLKTAGADAMGWRALALVQE